jgi:hypothetical protein
MMSSLGKRVVVGCREKSADERPDLTAVFILLSLSHVAGSRQCELLRYFVCCSQCSYYPPQTALAFARAWHHVDASERVLGEVAGRIAVVLMGKHKPIYDPACAFFPSNNSRYLISSGQLSGLRRLCRRHECATG